MGDSIAADALELRHLRVLVALADEGTFTDAAIRLRLSQPAVSRALARFENLLGVQLVERTTRSLRLTEAGLACYGPAVATLLAYDGVLDAARGHRRPLRLGYSWAAFGRYTSAVLQTWRREHADVPLEVHRIDERSAGLRSGLADIAVRRGTVEDDGVHVEPIFTEGRVAAVPSGSPLARRASLRLADLRPEVIALSPIAGNTTLALWPAADRPVRTVELANVDEWLLAIVSGEAVGVTAASTAALHAQPGVRFVPLDDATPLTVSLVWPRRPVHASVADFVAVVHRCVAA